MPAWMTAFWALGVWGAVVGTLLLFARSRWSLHAFVASLGGLLVSLVYTHLLTNGREIMGQPVLIMNGVVLVGCLFFLWYAQRMLSRDEIAFVRGLVLFEDAEILALNKPSGLSSQGGRGQVHTLDELLWAFAKQGKARPRLIHRLDRDTSGVILTAKTKPAAGFLGKALMARKFSKTYAAIVTPGAPDPPSGIIETPLRRDEQGREAYMRVCAADHPDAETARSRYRTLSSASGAALMELDPDT
eukprot:gene28835-50732_t